MVSHSNVELAGLDAPQRVARAAVHDALDSDANEAWMYDLDVVASEVVTNALKHTPGVVRMRLEIYERGVAMGVIDRGADFDPLTVVPATADPDEMIEATGGRGLLIVSCLARELKVEPVAGGKIVTAVLERTAGAR
ncbi:hypothetical protein ADK41_00690 [Streptomyces caelestis]|uniref:Histidine kinase/HSP90-like ATPase domain-containing protein n=2 Tax=Streptomyces TaxID=1883 RepID=A0A0M8QRP0_9ACTN|nr:hypothetical protein ADK41_00690 [Streptomyces caelestis]